MAKAEPTAKTADPISLLKEDHRAVESLFAAFEEAEDSKKKRRLAGTICKELLVHCAIEEEVFYPALRGAVDDHLLDEGQVEHDGAKMLIAELMAGSPDQPFYDAKVKVLSEMIKHHVKEEEQRNGLFAQAKRADVDLKALGERLEARKAELSRSYEDGLPRPTTRSFLGARVRHQRPAAPRA